MSVLWPLRNLRDVVKLLVPDWMAEAKELASYGFQYLTTVGLLVDGALEILMASSLAAVGKGTPTAFPYVGQARGMIQNQNESAADYGARLPTWIDRAKENGSTYRFATALQSYLRSGPRIRVFMRDGSGFTLATDGTITDFESSAWDWDSVSHPERNDPGSPWFGDLFVIVYTTTGSEEQWPVRAGTYGGMVSDGLGIGHQCTRQEVDSILELAGICKSSRSALRAIVWCSDATKFVPTDDASMPDGTWGRWGMYDGADYVKSGRDLVSCRYWELASESGEDPLTEAVG